MLETPWALLDAIRLGEGSRLEFKVVVFAGGKVKGPARDDVADELAAFANAGGGTYVFGVDDKTKEIVGIPEPRLDEVDRFLGDLCQDSVTPALYPTILRLRLPAADSREHPVIRVDVPRSLFVHRSPGGYWYRVGSSKRKMSSDDLARLMHQRSQDRLIRFDQQIVPGTTLQDLDAKFVNRFRTDRSADDLPALTRKLAMSSEDQDGIWRLTVAGVLLGTEHPERWIAHAFVQAVAYRGTTIDAGTAYQLDAKDLTGPLDQQVIDGCLFVARNMRMEASKQVGRRDTPQYDMTAVFEALVNAVAHRDYSMYGSKIRLRVFADRLELYTPGPLVNTMNVEAIAVRQSSRNEAITNLLAKCPVPRNIEGLTSSRSTMMDRRGEGVPIILRLSEDLSGKCPVYATPDESELILTIYAASAEPAREL